MDSIEAVHFCSDSLNGLMPLQRLRLVSAGVAWEGSGVGYLSSGREGAQALLQLFQLLLELLQGHGWLLCASIPAAACQWLITHLLHHTHCHVASLHGSSHSSVTQTYCCSICTRCCASKSTCACAFAICSGWLHNAQCAY